MTKAKLLALAVLALLLAITVIQNTEPVEARFLFFTITMPRAVLITATALIGFALGVVTTLLVERRSRTTAEQQQQQ
ncbi:MAG: LapA family protein [Desulfobulbaceae bacterium]|nr:LapA family protein [Desulfobulbaceae bacterium]